VIKATRSLNMKVFLEVTRTMPNRFYTNVLKSFLHILRILRGKEIDASELSFNDHDDVLDFIKD
jgi:hypothetical protein